MREIKYTQLLHDFSVNTTFNTLACYQFTTTDLNNMQFQIPLPTQH